MITIPGFLIVQLECYLDLDLSSNICHIILEIISWKEIISVFFVHFKLLQKVNFQKCIIFLT